MATIEGVEVEGGAEAVVVWAERPLTVVSSSVVGGGLGHARAEVAVRNAHGINAFVVATVGLSNPVAAGRSAAAPATPGTINIIVVVDVAVEPAALVNLALTVTEAKTLVLAAAGVRCHDGHGASGTSTDAVVVAATGRGPIARFGGPISDAGWVVAQATRAALAEGVRRW